VIYQEKWAKTRESFSFFTQFFTQWKCPLCCAYKLLLDLPRPPPQQNTSPIEAPVLPRDLFKILELNPGIDTAAVNSKLHLLEWSGAGLSIVAAGAGGKIVQLLA
jgi:hypothetical protein